MKYSIVITIVVGLVLVGYVGCRHSGEGILEATFCPAERSSRPAFSERNLTGLKDAGDTPIEFTGKVVRIRDNVSALTEDPSAVPYTVYFELVRGEIPGYPDANEFMLFPPYEVGIDSIGRFTPAQEVVFVCSSDGALRGLKNVPSFEALLRKTQIPLSPRD